MLDKVISTVITFLVSGALGYCISLLKSKKKKINASDEALKTLLQNSLTNTYFVYEKIGKIPDYVYKNWLNLLKAYEGLGGNDYIHQLAKRMESWEIEKTDILK